MARNTDKQLRNQVIYSIFVRNYSEEGTFEEVRKDLPRIKALGVDIIWLMPIQPSGKKNRKGTLGSPYAISDYRAINPEFGTMEDFIRLTEEIHDLGMRCMIDVVYNHTSPDSVLSVEHPEWFYHKPDGSFGNRVGDWWDVIDLDYTNRDLWDYQIETLVMWAKYVDGFRCDVAPMVPVDFWKEAREAVEQVRPGAIWLAESVQPIFIKMNREIGIDCASDSEIYRAFDMCYDYDVYDTFFDYFAGECSLSDYAKAVQNQEYIYPDNYVKARFLENHDRQRAASYITSEIALRNWTAFIYFQKGATLLYAGQERGCEHTPSLFDKDTVPFMSERFSGLDLSDYMAHLYEIKKNPIFTDSSYEIMALPKERIVAIHTKNCDLVHLQDKKERMVGVFSVTGEAGPINVRETSIPDGTYVDLISGKEISVEYGMLMTDGEPMIFMA